MRLKKRERKKEKEKEKERERERERKKGKKGNVYNDDPRVKPTQTDLSTHQFFINPSMRYIGIEHEIITMI